MAPPKKKPVSEVEPNPAKDEVYSILVNSGFSPQEGEKAWDVVLRFAKEMQNKVEELDKVILQMEKTFEENWTALKEEKELLEEKVSSLQENPPEPEGEAPWIALLKRSSSGFSDGKDYRDYCLEVIDFLSNIK